MKQGGSLTHLTRDDLHLDEPHRWRVVSVMTPGDLDKIRWPQRTLLADQGHRRNRQCRQLEHCFSDSFSEHSHRNMGGRA
jgi:hypothetical protein